MKKLLILTTIVTSTVVVGANAENHSHSHDDNAGRIGFEKAKEIALDAVKNHLKVVESELEINEDGKATYEIEIDAGGVVTEVEIDAVTGKVKEMEAVD